MTKPTACASPDSAFQAIGYMNGALSEWMAELVTDPEKFVGEVAIAPFGKTGGPIAECSPVALKAATAKEGFYGIRCCAD